MLRFTVLLLLGMLFGVSSFQSSVHAAEKSRKQERKEAKREKAVQGDAIRFALAHAEDLKLTKDQIAFLQKLKEQLADERAKEPEEIKIVDLRGTMRADRKSGRGEESQLIQDQLKEFVEKQGSKWEERTNAELAKVLPKDMQEKLKELRGTPEPPMANPFEN